MRRHDVYPPKACIVGIGALPAASLEDVTAHLVNLSTIPRETLRKWEMAKTFTRGYSKRSMSSRPPTRDGAAVHEPADTAGFGGGRGITVLPPRRGGGSLLDHLKSSYEVLAALARRAGNQ